MKVDKLISIPPLSEGVSALFITLSLFTVAALFPIPIAVRPIFLTVGAFSIILFSLALTILRASLRGTILTLTVISIALFWTTAFPAAINGADDNAAYLVFAELFFEELERTIQPLSERRLFSVGGNYAFQGPILHWLGPQGLTLVEPGLGLLLLMAIFLDRRAIPVCGLLIGLAFLAVIPAMGSRILANTASTFIISAFSFALMIVTLRIISEPKVSAVELLLLLALPATAALYRPTTIPFNVLLCCAAISIAFYYGNLKKTLFAALLLLVLAPLVGALLSYYPVGSTLLYPVLGKGTHVTGMTDLTITGDVDVITHIYNIFYSSTRDPLFLAAIISAISALVFIKSRLRLGFLAVLTSYVIFVIVMVISTTGVAAMRYVSPISAALILTSMTLAMEGSANAMGKVDRRIPSLSLLLFLAIAIGLIGLRVKSQGVVEQRLKMYRPSLENQIVFDSIATHVHASTSVDGKVLLVGVEDGRFLMPVLNRSLLIMDQPGALLPWGASHPNYTEGLRDYLHKNGVEAILSSAVDCDEPGLVNAKGGWTRVMELARRENDSALCALGLGVVPLGNYQLRVLDSRLYTGRTTQRR